MTYFDKTDFISMSLANDVYKIMQHIILSPPFSRLISFTVYIY